MISIADYNEAVRFIETADRHPIRSPERQAALYSAIIFYARPYSQNETRRNRDTAAAAINLEGIIDPARVLAPENVALHERIIAMRNKTVAHAEADYHPANFIGPASRRTVWTSTRWDVESEAIDLVAFKAIAQYMAGACGALIVDPAAAVGAGTVRALPP
jgi:hypothetical protein